MKIDLTFILLMFVSLSNIAQEATDKKPFTVKFTGQVKNDFFGDSRQTVSAREGHFLLYPAQVVKDANGLDINSHPNFNFLSIQSTAGVDLTGPDVLGAKTLAKIEVDFFGQLNDNINLLRMRHAWLKFKWEKTELLFGQYWIPFFIPGCYPNTVSFNTGSPIQPFGRNPQIRLSQKMGSLNLIAIASSQRDYPNTGPMGASGEYLRNSGIPALDLQLIYDKQNQQTGTALLAGFGGGYKKIVPRLSFLGFKSNDGVESLSALAFLKVQLKPVTLKFEAVYGQNADDALMLGGYAIQTVDSARGKTVYMPSRTSSYWAEIQTNGKKIQFGLFAGYTQNYGFKNSILTVSSLTGRALNIKSLYRISPRITYNMEHIRFAIETEYTSADYGSGYDNSGVSTNTTKADNMRILFSTYYFIK